jgi:hypothetical protein
MPLSNSTSCSHDADFRAINTATPPRLPPDQSQPNLPLLEYITITNISSFSFPRRKLAAYLPTVGSV